MTDVPNDTDATRFRSLYQHNFASLLAYALRRVAQSDQASDIVAETMLVAWRRLNEVPTGSEERLWLFGVARRVLANQRRGTSRHLRLLDKLSERVSLAVQSADDGVVVIRLDLQRAMLGLSDLEREIVELTSWEDLTPSDAAVVLGIPVATARTRLHRARARLRASLDGDSAERSGVAGHVNAGSTSAPGATEETVR